MVTYTLKVVEIKQETNDTVTICFKQPGLKKIKYQAGQYLTLIFKINGRRYLRPYSFSSAPSVDSHLEITIKRVQNGIVSNHVHDVVKIGDSIEVLQPMGEFLYQHDEDIKNVFFWGVGSGITPLFSMIKEILKNYQSVNVNLIYGTKDNENTIFLNKINNLLSYQSDRFKTWNFQSNLSIAEQYPYLIKGRIEREKILEILSGFSLSESLHYICGPAGLKESVREVLKSLGIPDSNVLFEDFELQKDPADFTDIITRQIKLDYNGREYALEIIKGKSILECALDAGIELPYSCQTGSCSTCKGNLISGISKMIGLSKEREDLSANEFLLCCTYPLSDNVSIEI